MCQSSGGMQCSLMCAPLAAKHGIQSSLPRGQRSAHRTPLRSMAINLTPREQHALRSFSEERAKRIRTSTLPPRARLSSQ